MLCRIDIRQVRLGMYIHALDCSWLQNPFWRNRFLLTTQAELDLLLASRVATVVIDDARGVGVAELAEVTGPAPPPPLPVSAPGPSRHIARRPSRGPSEVQRAQATVDRAKTAVTRMFSEARLGQTLQLDCVAPLVDEIACSVVRDQAAMIKVTRLKNKNEYTYLHSVAVCALMINLARHLGLGEEQTRQIGMAGLLHDIGKMAVPEHILEKPGALDDGEFDVMRSHPEQGHALLVDCPDVSDLALDVCLHHHERIDGRGYPYGLSGDEISLCARMGAICDVYDAVTSDRPYKRPWTPNEALARMCDWEGHFDADLLDAFIASIGIPPIGALLRLHSNRLAVVIAGNADDPTLPVVRAFFAVPDHAFVAHEDIALGAAHGDPAIRSEHGPYWFGAHWDAVRAAVREGRVPTLAAEEIGRPYVASARAVPAADVAKRSGRRAGGGA